MGNSLKLSVEALRAQHETWAPRAREHQEEREQLFSDLQRDLRDARRKRLIARSAATQDHPPTPDAVLGEVSRAIHVGHLIVDSQRKRASRHAAWYWDEYEKIQRLVDKIAQSPIVPKQDVRVSFYTSSEFRCEHGRYRKDCAELGEWVAIYQAEPKRHQRLGALLRKKGVDSDCQRPGDFCARDFQGGQPALVEGSSKTAHRYVVVESAEPMPEPPPYRVGKVLPRDKTRARRGGRPISPIRYHLTETVVPRLLDAGLKVHVSCSYVARILRAYFNDPLKDAKGETDLAHLWRRLKAERALHGCSDPPPQRRVAKTARKKD